MPHKLAIDFGTTNSVIAQWNADRRETVPLPGISVDMGGNHLIPSLLYVCDGRTGDVAIGAAVQTGGYDRLQDNRLFRNFKRSIGASSNLEPRIIDGVQWTDADAGQHFLRCLLEALPYKANDIEQLAITVPVAVLEGYTSWIRNALKGFPAERVSIVDESTAAALGYAVTEPGTNVLVIDFGGGTLDISLVRLPETGTSEKQVSTLSSLLGGERGNLAHVIAKAGINLGGSDIDHWLLTEVLSRAKIPALNLGLGYAPLLTTCENAKVVLSTKNDAEVIVKPESGSKHSITITRAELEALMEQHGFYAALCQLLDRVMGLAHQRGVFKEDISNVLLVGGTSLIPSAQRTLDTYFRTITQGRQKIRLPTWPALHWKVENTSIRVDKPFTAVVEGALQVSAGLGLDDRLTYSYGLRVLDSASGLIRYEEVIPAGSRYPSPVVTVKLAAATPQQDFINLVIGQIDTSAVSAVEVQYEAGQAVFVSKPDQNALRIVPLNAEQPVCVRLTPHGIPGKERLSAAFHVDKSRQLHIAVTDLKTGKKLVKDIIALIPSFEGEKELKANNEDTVNGSEPALVVSPAFGGGYRLSLRNLASALNLLSPSQVSSDVLAAALRSNDCLARFNAAKLLCQRGDRDSRLIFDDVLTHGTPPQRATVARHLYQFSWFVAEPLFKRALNDPDVRVREGAVFALCKMRAPEAYRLALNTLNSHDVNDGLRMSAIWGVYSNPDAGAIPVLTQTLAAESPKIREQALEVLGATGSTDAIPIVCGALTDPGLDVKYAAVLSWVELAGENCFVELAHLIAATHGEDRRVILRAFFHVTNYMGIEVALSSAINEIVTALRFALADALPQTRISAILPLAWIHHPLTEQMLYEGFQYERDSNVKMYMLSYAVNFSSPAADELLRLSLKDDDNLIRQTGEYLQSVRKNHQQV